MKMETVLYKALVASNVPDEHATAVIEAMEKEMTSVFASKTDVSAVRTELKADIAVLRSEVKADISALRSEVKADISALRTELKSDISELQKSLVKLDTKVDTLGKNLT
uniref:CCDC90 family protein n=1 Tax=Pseudomonas sp. MWU13-2105 TaxID=2935074 RepID=UPI0020109D18